MCIRQVSLRRRTSGIAVWLDAAAAAAAAADAAVVANLVINN